MTTPSATPPGTAVVTGASSGIGAVYADRLARRGHDLILVARRADRLTTLADRLRRDHKVAVRIEVADLADAADLDRVAALLASDPAISILVNNAGVATLKPLALSTPAEAASMLALNIAALTRLTQAVLPGLIARDRGLIINIASVLGLHALPVSGVYSGTKAYVIHFSQALQQELAGTAVKLHLVLPAATRTEIWDGAAGVLESLPDGAVMTTDHLVDAALAGLDAGEAVSLPPLEDATLWQGYETARTTLFAATATGTPASRYGVA